MSSQWFSSSKEDGKFQNLGFPRGTLERQQTSYQNQTGNSFTFRNLSSKITKRLAPWWQQPAKLFFDRVKGGPGRSTAFSKKWLWHPVRWDQWLLPLLPWEITQPTWGIMVCDSDSMIWPHGCRPWLLTLHLALPQPQAERPLPVSHKSSTTGWGGGGDPRDVPSRYYWLIFIIHY